MKISAGWCSKINFVNFEIFTKNFHSLNLSGPACGLDCNSTSSVDRQNNASEDEEETYNFPPEHRSELCETLCENELGV